MLIGVVLLLGVLYAVGYALTGDRVARGVTVAGVDIGGMSPDDAEDELRSELAPRMDEPVRLQHRAKTLRVVPSKAGLSVDIEETVREAGGGRTFNPVRMIDSLTDGNSDVEPVISVDDASLEKALSRVDRKVRRAPVEGRIRFRDGEARPVKPRPGLQLDTDAAGSALETAALDESSPVDVPTEEVPTEISNADVKQAMADFARPAMSAPIEVKVNGRTAQLTPETVGASLRVRPKDGELVPRLNAKKLTKDARGSLGDITRRPRPATVELRNGSPRVVPHKVGTRVKMKGLRDDILKALTESGDSRAVTAKAKKATPSFRTRDARKLQIDEVVSEFSTEFPHSDYRNTNLGQAAKRINGTVLKPDETFSFNDVVGERTEANGFTKGYIIDDGVLVEDYGGGVSQVATTVYNAGFFAGLKDVEHHPHSLYFDRYPIGREATVAWGALDLQFENNTPHGVLIETWIEPSTPSSDGSMHARIWSTKYWDVKAGKSDRYNKTQPGERYDTSDDCAAQTGTAGFDIDIHRYLSRDGERVKTETDEVTYDAADTVHCRAKP